MALRRTNASPSRIAVEPAGAGTLEERRRSAGRRPLGRIAGPQCNRFSRAVIRWWRWRGSPDRARPERAEIAGSDKVVLESAVDDRSEYRRQRSNVPPTYGIGGNSFHVTRPKTPCSGLAENGRPYTREPAVQWAEIERKAIERDT